MTPLRALSRVRLDSRKEQGLASEAVRVWLLGGFQVSVGHRTIGEDDWPLKKAASLLKLLALSPGHAVHREVLVDRLWPDLGRSAAANNLRGALHALRRIFEPYPTRSSRYVSLSHERVILCPEVPLRVDVDAFEEAAEIARHNREPASYRAAVELYSGELLPGDRYEDWAEDRRRELRATYLILLLELAGLYERGEEYERAIGTLRGALAEDPLRVEAHAGLMRLYARSARKSEALQQYQRLEVALRRKIGAEPDPEIQRLREEILSGAFPRHSPKDRPSTEVSVLGPHNLPAARDSFVGREQEVIELKRALSMTGLLTLTGPGGAGKSRLALETARDLLGAYPDGVWLVELAPLSEGGLVPQAVAQALGVRERPDQPLVQTLIESLCNSRCLLIVDNCEHVVEAVASLVDEFLSSCANLKILATSREPLDVAGETNWRVPALSVPGTDHLPAIEDLTRYESVRLFMQRARQKLPSFELTSTNAGAVAEICRRLDGIPLAIELATARMTALAVEEVAQRLEDSLNLLATGPRTAAPRHRTMRATLEWSFDLLGQAEKILFRRLSVFAGGWTLEAAVAVGRGEGRRDPEPLDLLNGLVDKSLVVAEVPTGEGAVRYRMLEPVRQYALERLEEGGEGERVRRRHAAFYLALAEAAEPELRGRSQATWLERLEREHDNFRAALSWALESGEGDLGLRLGGALGDFWHVRGYLNEGRRWLEDALAKRDASAAPARVRALAHAGYLAWAQIDYDRAAALSEEGLARSRELGDEASGAAALFVLGLVEMFQKRFEQASMLLEESLVLWRGQEDTSGIARTLQALGLVAVARHDYERAMPIHEESLALARKAGDNMGIILALGQGALAAVGRGEHDLAEDLCAEGLVLARQPGHPHVVMFILNVWAVLAAARGRPVHAARARGAAWALGRTIGITALSPVEQHHYGPYIAAARSGLGEAAWETALAEGEAMEVREVIEYALGTSELRVLPGSDDEVSAKVINKAGKLAWEQGDYASASAAHEESLRLHRQAGNKPGVALSLNNLGLVALYQGDHASATALYEESLSLRRELRDEKGTASSLHNLGLAAMYRGDYARAEAFFEESLSLAHELGDDWVISTVLNNLGLLVLHQGDYERASKLQRESLSLRRKLGDRGGAAECLEGLAGIAAARDDPLRAARLWSAAEALRETIGAPTPPTHNALYETYLVPASKDERAWEAARSEGRAMTADEAIAYALSEEKPAAPPVVQRALNGSGPERLTRREREIVALVARGMSNRRVGAELFISERTVETHVRNVLKKLSLRSRAQLAVWAAERD